MNTYSLIYPMFTMVILTFIVLLALFLQLDRASADVGIPSFSHYDVELNTWSAWLRCRAAWLGGAVYPLTWERASWS